MLVLPADIQGWVLLVLYAFEVITIGFAFLDAAFRRPSAFPAAEKQTKIFWLIILGLALAVLLVRPDPIGLFSLIGIIAGIVYLVDARPALRGVGKGRSNDGLYGP